VEREPLRHDNEEGTSVAMEEEERPRACDNRWTLLLAGGEFKRVMK
jgi:hypothetical protein